MPKQERGKVKVKKSPYQVDPEEKVAQKRKHSIRNAENFDEVLEKFKRVVTMGDESSEANSPGQGNKADGGGGGGGGGVLGPSGNLPTSPTNLTNQAQHQGPHQQPAGAGLVSGRDLDEAAIVAVDLANALSALKTRRVKPRKRLAAFSSVTGVSRRMVNELGVIVSLFTELKDIEREISEKYSEWLLVCGKSEAELEDADDPLKPSVMDTEIEDIGELLDKVVETFKKVKEQYPEKQEVLDYLDFLDTVPKQQDLGQKLNHSPSGSVASESVALGRGEQYLKTKIPILIQEVENRFKLVKDQFDAEAYTTENSLQDALKKLESIDRKITEDSTFERLLRELFDFNRVEFDKHEEWRQIQLTYIASLTTSLEESMEDKRVAKAEERKKPSTSYSTFFKKQDPPKFKGDCLEYVEFRKASQVSSHSPPDEFEIDLLKRNIPEEETL